MYQLENTHWWYVGMRRISKAFLGHAGNRRQLRVLDAGCGTGAGMDFLAPYGQAYGVDLSQDAIEFCQMRGKERLARSSVVDLPFVDSTFDLVVSFDVIYHRAVADDVQALREFHRVLNDGGRLLLRVPAFDFLRGHHDVMVHTQRRYTSRELAAKLKRAGFAVKRMSYANCLLFPLALAKRLRERDNSAASDVRPVGKLLNRLLVGVLGAEALWLRKFRLPFGVSVFALAQKGGT